jgi:hypothetical protein
MSYRCARCGSRKSLTLSFFFLCNDCATRLTTEAFNNNKPVFEGLQVKGYCYLCGKYTDVKLRQWPLCEDCSRIVHSYPIGIVAQECVLKWLREKITGIRFELTDPITLKPYSKNRKDKEPQPDITGYDIKGNKILVIEVKSGHSSIDEMKSFQLDISDCEDILKYVEKERVATYIFHVQVTEMFEPPTMYFKCAGIWWTDIFELSKNFQRKVKRRIDRGKMAAHYNPRCFKPVESFIDEIKSGRYKDLTDRLNSEILSSLCGQSSE